MSAEHDKLTVSTQQWRSYVWMAARLAAASMGWWSFCRSAVVAVLAYVAQNYIGLRTVSDTWKMVFTSLAAAAVVCLLEFIYHLLVAPARRFD